MSNEHTNDTSETTGARLTEAQVADFARLTAEPTPTWDILRTDVRQLEVYALDLRVGMSLALADRAALVAEVARLQAENADKQRQIDADGLLMEEQQHAYGQAIDTFIADNERLEAENARLEFDAGMRQIAAAVYLDDLHAAEAQVAAMRPLVEAWLELPLAVQGHYLQPENDWDRAEALSRQARALVATWQTPAAPRLTGRERIQALRDAQATPPTGEITAIMVSRDSELTEPAAAPTPDGQEGGEG